MLSGSPKAQFAPPLPRVTTDLSRWTADGRHNRRVKNLVLIGGMVVVIVSALWVGASITFLSHGTILAALMAFALGLVMVTLAFGNRVRAGALVMAHGLSLVVLLAALCEDPAPGV